MSRGTLYVLFPDGTVKYGIYNGTADIAYPPLVDNVDDAWDVWYIDRLDPGADPERYERLRRIDAWRYEKDSGEDVVIATDYGGGFWWRGKATKTHVTAAHEPHGEDLGWNGVGPEPEGGQDLPMWCTYPPPILQADQVKELMA